MRQPLAGPLARLENRLSLRVKLIGALTLVAVVVTVLAYFGLTRVTSDRIDDRVASRGDELAMAMGEASADDVELAGVAAGLVRLEDVRSIAYAPLDTNGEITTIEEDGTPGADPSSTGAGSTLAAYLVDPQALPDTPEPVEVRVVLLGDPLEAASSERYAVAIEVDEGAVASNLRFALLQALLVMVAGFVAILLSGYLLVEYVVTRRLRKLTLLDRVDLGGLASHPAAAEARDEVIQVRQHFAELASASMSAGRPDGGVEYILPETLPDIWLRIDGDLSVTEARVVSDDMSSGDISIDLRDLTDLLSGDVVAHIVDTIELIGAGEEEAFEFSVGVKTYRAILRAGAADYTLEISESPTTVRAVSQPTVETAEILAGLLEHLPVGVIDTDARGVIRYANRALFSANTVDGLIGRPLTEVVPASVAGDATQAIQDARHTLEPQLFVVPSDDRKELPGSTVHVVPLSDDDELSIFILVVQDRDREPARDTTGLIASLEEQLWALELKVSDYEEQIAGLSAAQDARAASGPAEAERSVELSSEVVEPMKALLASVALARDGDAAAHPVGTSVDVWSAVMTVAGVLDDQLGTDLVDASQIHAPQQDKRFHLATLLDEVAIAASKGDRTAGSRISAFVQPSLPKWLYGNERESRAAIIQMIEFARLVSGERPLILAAMQDTGEGRSVQVRFEVQIPSPVLNDDDMAMLRGCITGEVADDGLPSSLKRVLEASQATTFDALDIELVKINDDATALRCSSSFEIAEELDSDHSWVRGLRTLIIQGPGATDNGIQAALSAFGIIGYVVSDEEALVNALHIAEEYSNPYRFIIADVDTPRLEAFVSQLFDGDAPVVLVGKKSESAMVGAISAGYNGYIAKPVHQVEMLEVIMSTVEPPAQHSSASSRASAA